jgi:hypothetical protein
MPDDKEPKPEPAAPVQGGPGGEPEPQAPKLVAVKHGGRELQVPEDVAAAWQEREREYERRMSQQGAELGELRNWRKQAEPRLAPQPAAPAEPDINTLWFENPQAAYQKIKQEVREEIVGDYRKDQALRTFWDGFFRTHDDLREDDWLARAMFQEHFNELADLPTREAQQKLGEITRTQILRLTRKTKNPTDTTPRDLLEPASGDRPPRQPAPDDDGPQSISGLIAQRRQQRVAKRA